MAMYIRLFNLGFSTDFSPLNADFGAVARFDFDVFIPTSAVCLSVGPSSLEATTASSSYLFLSKTSLRPDLAIMVSNQYTDYLYYLH